MTKTVVQQIKENRLAALSLIRVVNGYRFDALPEMKSATTNTPKHGLIVLSMGGQTLADQQSYGREWFTQSFSASTVVTQSEYATDVTLDDAQAMLAAEIWRALSVDRQCNGLAIDTLYEGADPIDSEGSGLVAVTVSFSVDFWTLEGNPFSQ